MYEITLDIGIVDKDTDCPLKSVMMFQNKLMKGFTLNLMYRYYTIDLKLK